MGRSAWSIKLVEVVDAAPERVTAWWFDPDRRDEVQGRIPGGGVTDFALSESTTDGVRVRTISFRDAQGWTERHLTPDGDPGRSDNRFIVPSRDINEMRSPRGQQITLQCVGQMEFAPGPDGTTEISIEHSHTHWWVETGPPGERSGAPILTKKIGCSKDMIARMRRSPEHWVN